MPRRRRRSRGYVSGSIKRYLNAILFIVLGAFVTGAVSYMATLIPPQNLTIGSTSISNTLLINFIGWAFGVVFVLYGIRKFGIKI
jgi:hypothetical protein